MTKTVADFAAESMAYFPHDSNAHADIKCQRLIMRRGFDGYGRWWRLCEHMASIKGHQVPFTSSEDKLILGQILGFGGGSFEEILTIDETTGFIDELLEIGLLEINKDTGFLENTRMQSNAVYFGKQRYNGRKGGRPRKTSSQGKTAD